jgi:hypothetical protein
MGPMTDPRLEAWRCPTCRRIVGRMHLEGDSLVEVKCSCNTFTLIGSRGIIRSWTAEGRT